MMKAITAIGLVKDYRKIRALSGLSLEVERGEIFGFLGPNGAGKTTFIKIILGLVLPTAGMAEVMGSSAGNREVRSEIGYLPENMRLHGFLKGREFLDLAGKLYGLSRRDRERNAWQYLNRLGLSEDAERPLREYSKGMLQRIGIAQALMHDPDLLLLDEPTSGLDPIGTKDVRDIILDEKKKGKTIFINSHLLSEIERTCDRVAILHEGRIVKSGKLSELSTQEPVLHIEVENANKDLLAKLKKIARTVREEGNSYYLFLKDKKKKAEIPKIIVETGTTLVSISEERESLEDIFYRAVKGGKGT
jgi:ABC-2 type transport system ATP-binding protein